MARYTGPRKRKLRRVEVDLPGLTGKKFEDRPYPPGQEPRRRRRRLSEYKLRLREKQKLRWNYGVSEAQLRNLLAAAARSPGPTGENLLRLLERRLDNAVFRLGLAPTIPAARQLVRHGHIAVNGQRTSVPGYKVARGDRIRALAPSRDHPHIAEGARSGPALGLPSYLARDEDGLGGAVTGVPERSDIPFEVDERLVVEFYARV